MNNKEQKIKQLAILASQSNTIPEDISLYVINYLSKQDLKLFMRFYKNELDKKRIYVYSQEKLTDNNMKLLKNMYEKKDIILVVDHTLGAGLKIRQNDTIVDFTFKKYINDTIDTLKD